MPATRTENRRIYLDVQEGNVLEVIGDCPTFESNVRTCCERMGKTGGDPTDNPRFWVNQCYSLYYGLTVLGPDPSKAE